VTADQSPVTGITDTSVSKAITGLIPNTLYYYRVVGQNGGGTANGAAVTFTTAAAAPTVTTNAASGVGTTGATLNGTVNANNSSTTVTFEYGLDTSYGTTVTADQSPVSGVTDTAVSKAITGLTPNTTYHYRVVGQNAGGTTNGADMTFTTGLAAPTVTTNAASGISATGATLNGTVNANNSSTTVTFEYGLDTSYGTTVTADQSPVTGTTDTAVSKAITGLTPNTTYHYRAVGQNGGGTTNGADMTFTTGLAAPTVTTNAASGVGTTGATLNGTVNANNDSTTVTFEYGLNTSYGTTVTADQSPVAGTTGTAVSKAITGLIPNTTYHYRAVGQNGGGTTNGADMTFTTSAAAPTVTTNAASGVGTTGATLNGTVNANNSSTTVTFEYGLDTSYGTTVTADQSPVTGTTDTAVSKAITGLTPNTTYHYRAVGQNAGGTGNGADMTFTTGLAAPTVTTNAASGVSTTGATLNGTVNANNASTTVTFEYGLDTSYGTTVTADQSPVSGTTNTAVSKAITGLTPNTTYHYRVKGQNGGGTANGADMTFTTTMVLPTVTTRTITNITSSSAVSGGNVTDDGGGTVTARGVCWSTSPNPTIAGNKTTNGTGMGIFTSHITGLAENTTYYVRAYATNSVGTAYGNRLSFTTNAEAVTVTITEPQDGAEVSGTVLLKAEASSNPTALVNANAVIQAVQKVEFYVDDARIAEDASEPYETSWDTTSYSDGTHTIKAVAYNADNQASQDEITVQVVNTPAEPPEIMINHTRLNFGSTPQAGTDSSGLASTDLTTGPQTILINHIGGGVLNWTVSKDTGWLSCTPGSGNGNGMVTVYVDPAGLPEGTYTGTILIQDPNAVNSPVTVPVTLKVYAAGTTTPPFGYFETPTDDAVVQSSVPVTGWAADDIEITSVKIFRAPIPGHETSIIYIGDAVQVEGARPDVEQTFPGYPKIYQAGWGYMLLTNFLPNQGNGTFTLYAIAMDKEGNEVTLGSKTVTGDNANAVKPFGAIDTPGQGGIASGKAFVNFGWALTPQPNTIPTDGSTIIVWVDGVPLGNPVYNSRREDIAVLFPGYNNSSGAGGHFFLDTTKYINGVHTIAWSVEDDAGNQDGVGSRFFSIQNIEGAGISSLSRRSTKQQYVSTTEVQGAALSPGPIYVFTGYNRHAAPKVYYPDDEGIIIIGLKEGDRIEILPGSGDMPVNVNTTYGYMLKGDRLQLLLAGSFMDSARGIFYWQPGAGYFGKYQLVFVEKSVDGQVTKKFIQLVVNPKY
jgi:phosphodiesterase/alkaline phosphatase D-like protein